MPELPEVTTTPEVKNNVDPSSKAKLTTGQDAFKIYHETRSAIFNF